MPTGVDIDGHDYEVNFCMTIYIYIHIYTYVYIAIHIPIHMHVHVHMQKHVHRYVINKSLKIRIWKVNVCNLATSNPASSLQTVQSMCSSVQKFSKACLSFARWTILTRKG